MLAVDGQQGRAVCAAASVISAPAVTSASLLASATVLPGFDRGHDRLQARRSRRSPRSPARPRPRRPRPAPLRRPRRGSRFRQAAPRSSREAGFVGDDRQLRTGAPGDVGQRLDIGRGGHRHDLEPVGRALDQVERRLADRAGGAEDRDLAPHVRPNSCAAAVSTATGTRPSSRSSTPPWPGSQAPNP